MEQLGVPALPDREAGGVRERAEEALHLGAWFQRSATGFGLAGEGGADFVAGMFDRFREADALGYDNNEGENVEN